MVGIFQADLPFGKRFWHLLVVVAFFALFNQNILASVPSDPLRFATEAFLLFGFASGVSFVGGVALFFAYYFLIYPRTERTRHLARENILMRYLMERRYFEGFGTRLLINGMFFIAAASAIFFYGAPWVRIGGIVGLVIMIGWEALARVNRAASEEDLLKLTWEADGMSLCLRFSEPRAQEKLECVDHLEDLIFDLTSAGWRPVNVLEPSPKLQMLLFAREHDLEGAVALSVSLSHVVND